VVLEVKLGATELLGIVKLSFFEACHTVCVC
jgi:hypothetical protein